MAMPVSVEQKWRQLNAANQTHATRFIDFLLAQQHDTNVPQSHSRIEFDLWKSEPHYIAEDFDDPLEDFKAYTE